MKDLGKDHIVPKRVVSDLGREFKLTPKELDQLENDPNNLQWLPMDAIYSKEMVCSPNKWEEINGEPVHPEYLKDLEREQRKIIKEFRKEMEAMQKIKKPKESKVNLLKNFLKKWKK